MTNQQQEMIEYTTQEVICYLIEDNKIQMEQAMEQFYLSETFEKLNDVETGLYLEGLAYIYELLNRERHAAEHKERDSFDYTEWQRGLWNGKSIEEIHAVATACEKSNK